MACSKAISEGTAIPKSGIIFVEARIRDNVDLSADETKVSECHSFIDITLNNSSVDTRCPWRFIVGTVTDAWFRRGHSSKPEPYAKHLFVFGLTDLFPEALLLLGHSHEAVERKLHSLKVVDYSGPKKGAICHSSDEVRIKVQAYKLYKTAESSEGLHQAEITPMPHIKFDRQWNE